MIPCRANLLAGCQVNEVKCQTLNEMYCVKRASAEFPISHVAFCPHAGLWGNYRSHGPGLWAMGALEVYTGMWDTCRAPLAAGTCSCPQPVPGVPPLCPHGEDCTAASQHPRHPQLTGHPLCPSGCALRGPASPQGMVEDALCWASCGCAGGHLLPECPPGRLFIR